ncbi:Uncharacterised protein [Mycobacteroides abscessus subsp. abscessus]|nr:Uncharacterised protein [Mycobacteroides abscessus subsp. abscessus]
MLTSRLSKSRSPITDRSRFASSSTMAADFPPSSSVTGRSICPQVVAICLPAAVEPVNATLSMSAWATR